MDFGLTAFGCGARKRSDQEWGRDWVSLARPLGGPSATLASPKRHASVKTSKWLCFQRGSQEIIQR